jgi:Flp pilus assembly protein TadG
VRYGLDHFARVIKSFLSRGDGNVAITFALFSSVLFVAIGGGIDLSRAYNASQELTDVANLGCQYASRPSIVQNASVSGGGPTYVSSVKSFINTSLQSQRFPYTQTNSTPFTYTPNGPANVSLAATVPTVFAQIINLNTIPISATAHCYDSPSSVQQIVPNGNSNILAQEGFEATTNCSQSICYNKPNGTAEGYAGGTITLTTTQTASPGYQGSAGTNWYILGYCVETDTAGHAIATVPQGFREAELDCDNGSNSAGNSSISTSVYLPAGSYELRYDYSGRVDYANYDPVYLCGSTASDLSWANDTNSSNTSPNALRTNQINVYLDANTNGTIPTHKTIDGTENLGGSNLIDMCVYSKSWIERSVRINITTAGYYWLSFAADGKNDSYGGQLDNIRLCNGTCTGSVQDNFPSAWTSSPTLFEDTFDLPLYTGGAYSTNGNMGLSLGTSGASSGWPGQSTSGWSNAPVNQVLYWMQSCPQGTQCVALGWQTSNNLISRPFLLDPGYYKVTYDYISEVTFSGLSGAYCGVDPSSANISTLSSRNGTATDRVLGVNQGTVTEDTNTVGVFMAHAQLASTPNLSTTLGATVTYTNPDGTVTTTPTNPPNSISLTNYDSTQNNPLLDICGYAASSQLRTAYILIQKPAYYWLTLAALGAADKLGGQIDDIKLTAVGSLYGTAPSGNLVTIPVPAPQPGISYTNSGAFSGFSITADPLTVPAP